MAIRFRELMYNTFAGLKAKLETLYNAETDPANVYVQFETLPGAVFKAYLTQQYAPVSSVVFTGSGVNDMTAGATYTGEEDAIFEVTIDSEGTPDTFKWSKNGVEQATGVAITGSAQSLGGEVSVTFTATTGHTATESWTFSVMIA